MFTLARRLASEILGSALLLMGVVGSGIMGTNLSPDDGVALLANMAATGAILSVVSAHFMFEIELLQSSKKLRSGPSQWY